MRAPPSLRSPPGARLSADGTCRFAVWAPARRRVDVVLHGQGGRSVPMAAGDDGVFRAAVAGIEAGSRYSYRLDDELERPDPASRHQPDGVHGASAVVAHRQPAPFSCPLLEDLALFELHVGTFTAAGTFAAASERLDHLVQLGVNAVQLMPVAQFPGARNWGYDGVYAFAVQASYGGPDGLAAFVEACHLRGIAVLLDVVYNHLGPEGNYLADFGPYFDGRYVTPWGPALNFDGPGSDGVRWHFISSACFFLEELGIDGFRIDAVHAFLDTSAQPFLQQLTGTLHERAARLGRRVHIVGESDLDDARVLLPAEVGGFGMDGQWSDDFHHALHTLLTGERDGYYQDFGGLEQLAVAYREGWVFAGEWSQHRRRRHGNSPRAFEPSRFVAYAQTHDQVGNRARGDRLAASLPLAKQKLAAAAVLLGPFVPMLFMGEEYGETAPFLYFTSHGDPALQAAVRAGRLREFAAFGWSADELSDPQAETTFARSRLDWSAREREPHRTLLELHRRLLALRREVPALQQPRKARLEVYAYEASGVLAVRRRYDGHWAVLLLNFAEEPARLRLPLARGSWTKLLDTEDPRWRGAGSEVPAAVVGGEPELNLPATAAVLLASEATI